MLRLSGVFLKSPIFRQIYSSQNESPEISENFVLASPSCFEIGVPLSTKNLKHSEKPIF